MTLAKYLKVALISNYSEDVVSNDVKNYQKHRFPLPTFARVLKFPGYVTLQQEGRRPFNCFHFFFLLFFILKRIGQFFQGAYEPQRTLRFIFWKIFCTTPKIFWSWKLFSFKTKVWRMNHFLSFYYL